MTNMIEQPKTVLAFEQLPRETTKAFAAFKTYLDLGPNRSLVSAAAKMGCSNITVWDHDTLEDRIVEPEI